MRVRVGGIKFRGAAQMFDCIFGAANFVQNAAQIEMRHDIVSLALQRRTKGCMGVLHFAALIINAPKIDVWFAPTRLHFDHLLVDTYSFIESTRPTFAAHGILEQLVGCARVHLANFRCSGGMKRQNKLARERLNGVLEAARGNRGDFAAAGKQAKLPDRNVYVGVASSEGCHGAEEFARGNPALGDGLYGTQSDEISEIVEMLAPARFRNHESKTVPVTQAARINAHNSADFALRKTLWQAVFSWQSRGLPPGPPRTLVKIMHPLSIA